MPEKQDQMIAHKVSQTLTNHNFRLVPFSYEIIQEDLQNLLLNII